MEVKMDIGLDQLIQAIRQLPLTELAKLKAEINRTDSKETDKKDLRAFLLQAPVFNGDQIALINETRKSINGWGGGELALLDTSVLIDFFRKTDKSNSRFYQLSNIYDTFYISVITEYEIFTGATSLVQKEY